MTPGAFRWTEKEEGRLEELRNTSYGEFTTSDARWLVRWLSAALTELERREAELGKATELLKRWMEAASPVDGPVFQVADATPSTPTPAATGKIPSSSTMSLARYGRRHRRRTPKWSRGQRGSAVTPPPPAEGPQLAAEFDKLMTQEHEWSALADWCFRNQAALRAALNATRTRGGE